MLNLFSMYCSARLLMDPNLDPSALLYEISSDVVGAEYAEPLYEVLTIIQDARSGDRWETFRWNNNQFIMKSYSYNARDILDRCNSSIPKLEEMIEADLHNNRIPLAIPAKELANCCVSNGNINNF